jgi:hypothetical protein
VTCVVEPGGDVSRVEADEPADLEEGDSSLGDQATDVADGDAKLVGDLVDGEEVGEWVGVDHGCLLL